MLARALLSYVLLAAWLVVPVGAAYAGLAWRDRRVARARRAAWRAGRVRAAARVSVDS